MDGPVALIDNHLELGTPEAFLKTPAMETSPSFSPDGNWMAYVSNDTGAQEVYVRRFPDDGTKVRVSDSGGTVPRWSPNGRELLYRTIDQRVMVATYRIEGGSFTVGAPQPWAAHALADTGVLPNFDVAPDGERIVALMPAARPEDRQSPNHVTFVINFVAEVRRRLVPTQK